MLQKSKTKELCVSFHQKRFNWYSINVVVPSYKSGIPVFLISQCVYVCFKNSKYNFNSLKFCFHYPSLHFGFKVFNGYLYLCIRRAWRYQRGNQNPYTEETTQWRKEKRYKRTHNDQQKIHIKLEIE